MDLADLLVGLLRVVRVVLVLLPLALCHDFADLEQEFLHFPEVVPLLMGCSVGEGVLEGFLRGLVLPHGDECLPDVQQEVIVVDVEAN